jgi:hypothetical protein
MAMAPLTKLGGDLNFLSASMDWSVERPVRRGEEITAELKITSLRPAEGMQKISFDGRVSCGSETVIRGQSRGVILDA